MNDSLYPPTIQGAPPELTIPNWAYRRQVVVVLISLIVFVLFYLGLVVGSGWAVVWALNAGFNAEPTQPGGHSDANNYFAIAVVTGVLFLFLVKAFFKWQKAERELRIEITEQEHPELFAFIRRICADTHAPFPKRVFVSPEVNAAVFYDSSVLNLIVPVKKNLLIGLGLVNGLNLSEFKAVLAHEFGHFSQSSMRLGSYVYVANRLIYDLVYHRDKLDELLAQARRTNIRIAIFAYLITGVLWVLRKILQGAFRLINFFERALSRQMEFHADLVAVSVTGSDSLIHGLKKLEFVNACLMQAFQDLKTASDHQIYTQDIFYHQTCAQAHLRRIANEADLGQVPALPADPRQKTQLFQKEDAETERDGMWASHPSNYDREQNAKRHYLRSVEDERSPWLLFHNPEQLRRRMTERFYQHVLELKGTNLTPAAQVQAWIDDEHAETTQDPRYEGLYDGRPLTIPTDELRAYASDPTLQSLSPNAIEATVNRLYNAEYKGWLEAHAARREERAKLSALEEEKGKKVVVEFRGRTYGKADIAALEQRVDQELEADAEWLKAFDKEVFQTHLRMAQIVGEGDADLLLRYEFHLQLQDTLRAARQEELRLGGLFQYLSTKEGSLKQAEFSQVTTALSEIQRRLSGIYEKTKKIYLPPLQNMQANEPLVTYLFPDPLVGQSPFGANPDHIDGKWIAALGQQISQVEERSRRLYFKSMGAILTRQEAITESYRRRMLDAAPQLASEDQTTTV